MLRHVEVEELLHLGATDQRLKVEQKLETFLIANFTKGGVRVISAKNGMERRVSIFKAKALHVLPH